jgi:multidrug efflux pump subunit AcrA (membrane-fusion protein)
MSILKQILQFALNHKIIAGIIILVAIFSGYQGYQALTDNTEEPRYVLAAAEKGEIIVSVSGSGQVSTSNQVDLKAKTSGDVVYIGVKNAQEVKTGTLLVQLDAREAQKSVRDAELNLESAKLDLEKLKQPADQLSTTQAENALAQAKESKQKAEDDLKKAYEDGFNTISNAFIDLPGVLTGIDDVFFDEGDFEAYQWNIDWYLNQVSLDNRDKATRYRDDVTTAYNKTRTAYTKNFENYKASSRTSDTETIKALIAQTYETTKLIAETVKESNNYIDFVQDYMERYDRTIPSLLSTHQSNIDSYTGITNSHLLNLLSIQTTIRTSAESIINSDRTISEKTESLAKIRAGAKAIDIQSQELTIRQRENTLKDAEEKLSNYFIRAPFDSIVANINVKNGEPISTNAIVAKIIARQQIAEISLNEIDIVQVEVGQKTILTFDAVPNVSITGEVVEIDTIGTVSQGVVSYIVKISFDTQDHRVKPAMSVTADIITNEKSDVLIVPNSAVKIQDDVAFVEIPEGTIPQARAMNPQGTVLRASPRQQTVEIGIANDDFTEIISGLNEGDIVVTRKIQPSAETATPQGGFFGGGGR